MRQEDQTAGVEPESENDQFGNRKLEDLAKRKDESAPWHKTDEEPYFRQGRKVR